MQFADIQSARERISAYLAPTPTVKSAFLSSRLGVDIRLKLETQQPTGSFKVRPALNGILAHLEQCRKAGVVTSSSGNYAQATAYSATLLNVDSIVVMMQNASELKRRRTEAFGAKVVLCENTFESRWSTTFEIQKESGRLLLHPYDSAETVAGDGTLGLELCEQIDGDFTVLVPISGGGLVSGVATAVKAVRPGARVIGVQTVANPSMRRSVDAGERVTVSPNPSLADALAVATPGERTFEIVSRLVDDVVLVEESEVAEAVRILALEQKLVVEGGGSVGVAALLAGKIPASSGPIVAVLSGGNIAPEKLAEIVTT